MATDTEHRPLGRDTWWDGAKRYQQIRGYVARAHLTDWITVDDEAEGLTDAGFERLVWTDGALDLSDPSVLTRLPCLPLAVSC